MVLPRLNQTLKTDITIPTVLDFKNYRTLSPEVAKGLCQNKTMDMYLSSLGITQETFNFIQNPCGLHDKSLLHDIDKAADIILNYINTGKPWDTILIFGDYDCDGVLATTIMYLAIQQIKKEGLKDTFTTTFIPDRVKNGYGMTKSTLQQVLNEKEDYKNIKLIVTVDNGIMSHEAVEQAKSQGIGIIITDHHTPAETLPNADAIVHPMLGKYPFAKISGCQVAYKLAQSLFEKANLTSTESAELLLYFYQLAAITIVSDVMPIANYDVTEMKNNENRGWLQSALLLMKKKPDWRIGILKEVLKLDDVDEISIGFYIAPTINAAGRMDSAMDALAFFTATDPEDALLKANWLFYINEQRKAKKKEIIETVDVQLDCPGIIIADERVPEGIAGILAGGYAGDNHKPCICFSRTEVVINDKSVPAWKGSARSAQNINLFELLCNIQETTQTIYGFGGHKEACGLTVLEENFKRFYKAYQEEVEKEIEDTNYIVNVVPVNGYEERMAFAEEIKKLKPFGNGFPLPKGIERLSISEIFITDSNHASFKSWQKVGAEFKLLEFWLFNKGNDILNNSKFNDMERTSKGKGVLLRAKKGQSVKTSFIFEYSWSLYQNKYDLNLNVIDYR